MDKGKGLSNSPPKKKKTRDEEIFEQVRKRLKAEGALLNKRIDILSSFASMKWKSETLTEETTTEETETDDSIYGTETEESEEELLVLTEGSLTNNPKGIIEKKNVEQAAENNPTEEIPLVLSPTGSSTSNPKGIKEEIKQIIHEEEEEKKKPKAADSSSDNTCTSAFPPPTCSTDKSLDTGKDELMKSPPGDQGSC